MTSSTVKHLPKFAGRQADFDEWKERLSIEISGLETAPWTKIDAILNGLERPQPTAIVNDANADGGNNAPPNNNAEITSWDSANNTLFSILYHLTQGPANRQLYSFRPRANGGKGNGIGAWNALIKKYEGNNMERRLHMIHCLNEVRIGDHQDPDDYFHRIDKLVDDLRDLGEEVSEARIMGQIIRDAPPRYQGIKQLHYSSSNYNLAGIKDAMIKIWRDQDMARSSSDR